MGPHLDVQIAHDLLKHLATRDRTVIGIETKRPPAEGESLVCLRRHGIEEELERCLHRFAIGAVVFLIDDATAIIDHTEQHESRCPSRVIQPHRGLELFEIRGADIKLPQLVAVLRLEPHRRWFAPQRAPTQTPYLQVMVDGRELGHASGGLDEPLRRLDPIVLQEPDRFARGHMSPLTIGRTDFHGRDEFQVALELGFGQDAGLTIIGTIGGAWLLPLLQRAVQCLWRDAIARRGLVHEAAALRTPGWQGAEAAPQIHQGLHRNGFTSHDG